jgi:hypothetical protein
MEAELDHPILQSWDVNVVLWLMLLILFVLGFYLFRRRKMSKEPIAKLNVLFGPQLITLIWLHRLIFEVPKNLAVIRDGFLKFWFKPYDFNDYSRYVLQYSILFAISLAFLYFGIILKKRHYAHARGIVLPILAFVFWYFAALCFAHIPDIILWLRAEWGAYSLRRSIPELLLSAAIGLLCTFIAHTLTRISSRTR